MQLWDVTKAQPLQVWKQDRGVSSAVSVFSRGGSRVVSLSEDGAVFSRDASRVLSWSWDGTVKLWDVTKAQPLQVWKHGSGVLAAVFSRDESRVLSWSGNGAVSLWDAALKDIDLTPAQRIVELEVRSATRLSPAGLLTELKPDELIATVCSPEYKAIERKTNSALLPPDDCKIGGVRP